MPASSFMATGWSRFAHMPASSFMATGWSRFAHMPASSFVATGQSRFAHMPASSLVATGQSRFAHMPASSFVATGRSRFAHMPASSLVATGQSRFAHMPASSFGATGWSRFAHMPASSLVGADLLTCLHLVGYVSKHIYSLEKHMFGYTSEQVCKHTSTRMGACLSNLHFNPVPGTLWSSISKILFLKFFVRTSSTQLLLLISSILHRSSSFWINWYCFLIFNLAELPVSK